MKQRGVGLLELMLSLAIVAFMLLMALQFYNHTQHHQAVSRLYRQVEMIRAAAQRWWGIHHQFSELSIDELIEKGYVEKKMGKTPWGAPIELAPEGGGEVMMTLVDLPSKACKALQQKLLSQNLMGEQAPNCDAEGTNGRGATYHFLFSGVR